MTSNFIGINNTGIHYLDSPDSGQAMVLLHSLSANAHVFHGLVANGLAEYFRLIIPDLRGRGDSSRVLEDYSLETQSRDLLGLLDHLELDKVVLCGHSFGGLLAIYFAAHYPERVARLALIDVAAELNPLTPALISFSTARLLAGYPSWDAFLAMVRRAPFMNRWDAAMLPFLRHDVKELGNGTVVPSCSWIDVTRAAAHVFAMSARDWYHLLGKIRCQATLIQATEPFVYDQFIVLPEQAERTVAMLPHCRHRKAEGNHLTMLFGQGARHINAALKELCRVGQRERTRA